MHTYSVSDKIKAAVKQHYQPSKPTFAAQPHWEANRRRQPAAGRHNGCSVTLPFR